MKTVFVLTLLLVTTAMSAGCAVHPSDTNPAPSKATLTQPASALACFPRQQPLATQVAESDAVVLVRRVASKKTASTETEPDGTTTYEVIDVSQSSRNRMEKGRRIRLEWDVPGTENGLYVLMGTTTGPNADGKLIEWGRPIEASNARFTYMTEAPAPDVNGARRLEYYAKFLTHTDQLIAGDADLEFIEAEEKDIAAIADLLPKKELRQWLSANHDHPVRLGLYGKLIGLCGDMSDAKNLETLITESSADEFRLGIDGAIYGYLLLTGVSGLDTIERTKLKPTKVENKKGEMVEVPFSEIYSTMVALRSIWTHGNNRISKERLRQSMRLVLDRPELADLVIADLAGWKDWSIQEDLMAMYDNEAYRVPSIKRAIIKYMYRCSIDFPKDKNGKPTGKKPAHVASAANHLKVLEKKDPELVRDAMRYVLN